MKERSFKNIWACDFEYQPRRGNLPRPLCMVATNLRTGKKIRLNENQLRSLRKAPFGVGQNDLFIAYYALAEFSCFHELGWNLPINCIDLFAEFRNLTNGVKAVESATLLSALAYFGLDALGSEEKEAMRALAIRGGDYSEAEMTALLDYCETDVVALVKLFPPILQNINVAHALLRGRYMKAASVIEKNGVPIDVEALNVLDENWSAIKEAMIAQVNKDFGVYDGQTFKSDRFEMYLQENNLAWPRTSSGKLALDVDTFRDMARCYPQLVPLKEARTSLSKLRLSDLEVGDDGRNRSSLSPFRARTGRNQPSTSRFVFGLSAWLRGLIRPPLGYAIAYLDWCQQEFAIAAALSGDVNMKRAYLSGDPYLAFAIQAGAIPEDGTKTSHASEREKFKQCVLAVQYGMGEESLALRIGRPVIEARKLLHLHRRTYKTFWEWSDRVVNHAALFNSLETTFGWKFHVSDRINERSIRNFPMQANGAEMLRLACCLLIENGFEVCAPVHDAILICVPQDQVGAAVSRAKSIMEQASAIVLGGFCLRTDEKLVPSSGRFMEPKGQAMWDQAFAIVETVKEGEVV